MPVIGLVTVAVLAYAPSRGGGTAELAPVAERLKALARAEGAEVVDGPVDKALREHARGWVAGEELRFFAEVRAAVDEGRRALERVEWARGDEALARAEALCRAEVARPAVPTLWAEAALLHGVVLYELGRPRDAERAFRRAAALEPGVALTEAVVRPELVRAFERALKAPAERTRLTIEAAGAGRRDVDVWLDNKRVGVAPLALEVARGEHLVELRTPRRAAANLVDASEAEVGVTLTLPDDVLATELAGLRHQPRLAGLRGLAALLGVDEVWTVGVAAGDGEITLAGERWQASGCLSPLEVVRGASADAVARAWLAAVRGSRSAPRCAGFAAGEESGAVVVAAPELEPRAPAPPRRRPPPRRPRAWERPWMWMGVFAGATVAIGLAAGLSTQKTQYEVRLDATRFTH